MAYAVKLNSNHPTPYFHRDGITFGKNDKPVVVEKLSEAMKRDCERNILIATEVKKEKRS